MANFLLARTEITHEAQRAEAAADVPSDVHDKALDAMIFEVANDVVQAFGEILAYGSRERGHSDIPNVQGQNLIGEAARLDHWRPVFGCAVWHANRDFAPVAIEAADLHTMVASDTEGRRLRRNNRVGIYGQQEFSRADTRLERNAIFNYVDKHPTLSFGSVNGP